MKITSQQRKALEAAGYTVGKSGTTVQKDGKTIGGYNANGQMFSGSGKIRDILKAKPEAAPKAAPAPRATRSTRSAPAAKPTTKDGMAGYRPGDIRTTPIRDERKERVVKAASSALRRLGSGKPQAMTEAPRQPKPNTTIAPIRRVTK